jgi:glycosyltransferase involved in cell wall biosynthesis
MRRTEGWREAENSGNLDIVNASRPRVSVIVPTYNRCQMLRQTLDSLAGQRFDAGEFEVIVADDGSGDESEQVARSFSGRLRLRYCFQEDLGYRAAAARNAGARLASAPVLAFLDSGTLAGPDFVRGHLAAHSAPGDHAVLGYCYGYRPLDSMAWLAEALATLPLGEVMRRYGGDPAFSDVRHREFIRCGYDLSRLAAPWVFFWSMNCSVPAEAFWAVGGFDEDFRTWGAEDSELGYRLFRHGAAMVVSPGAWTIELPHERRLVANRQNLRRNSILFLHKHPDPMVELLCSAHLRDAEMPLDAGSQVLSSWSRRSAGMDVLAELRAAAAGLPEGASVAVVGCGPAVPASLPPSVLLDFDAELLGKALADGRHTGYNLIGVRTPLRARSVDAVIITSRLRGLWDRWGDLVTAEAHRIGRQVTGPPSCARGAA